MTSWGNVSGLSGNENGTIQAFGFYSADTIFAGTGSNTSGAMIRTNDKGVSWSTVNTFPKVTINSLVVAKNTTTGARVIFVATGTAGSNGTLYRSNDAGATWDSTPGPAATIGTKPRLRVRDIAVKPGQTDTLFIACGDNLDCAAGFSVDGGATIQTFENNFTGGTEMTSITLSKTFPDSVFIAMRREIGAVDFSSEKPIVNKYFKGLPGELIKDVFFDDLVMGSSVGFFSVSGSNVTVSEKSEPASRPHSQTANTWFKPAVEKSGHISISYNVPAISNVSISMYSLDGRKILTRHFGKTMAGTNSLRISTANISDGVYCITFHDGRTVLSRTVSLIRGN
jgi:hypothetical protein